MSKNDEEVMFLIEDDVPVPESKPSLISQFPIDTMKVGESLVFPKDIHKNMRSIASRLKKTIEQEYTIRTIDEKTCRIWRTK